MFRLFTPHPLPLRRGVKSVTPAEAEAKGKRFGFHDNPPKSAKQMARRRTIVQLEAEIEELEQENEELQVQLGTIADIVAPEEEEEDDGGLHNRPPHPSVIDGGGTAREDYDLTAGRVVRQGMVSPWLGTNDRELLRPVGSIPAWQETSASAPTRAERS
jgi:hypothetical protein